MPNKLTIRIETFPTNNPDNPNEQKTMSKFVVQQNDQVTFQNRAGADSTVNFTPENPLCKGNNQPPGNPFSVMAGGEEKLKVCSDPGQFEYKATVAGALPEDPILIVERALTGPAPDKGPIIFPEGVAILLVVAAVAAVAGYFVGRRRVARRS